MTSCHQGVGLCAHYSFDFERIILTSPFLVCSTHSDFYFISRWKSPKNEWRQQPWDVQTIPTIVRLRDVSAFRFNPSR